MPYTYHEAEVFLEHNGVVIYHIYKNDDMGEGERSFWFGLTPEASDNDEHDLNPVTGRAFDVRALDNNGVLTESRWSLEEHEQKIAIIKRAIDAGILRNPPEET